MQFCFEQAVALPIEQVFGFFQNPSRLELLYPGRPQIRLLHHEAQVRLGGETWVEVTVARCLPMVLGFRHHQFNPLSYFAEETVHGPFSTFYHRHEFEAQGEETLMRDLLEIQLPWYYGGEWVVKRMVAPIIHRMFQRRAATLSLLVKQGVFDRDWPRFDTLKNTA